MITHSRDEAGIVTVFSDFVTFSFQLEEGQNEIEQVIIRVKQEIKSAFLADFIAFTGNIDLKIEEKTSLEQLQNAVNLLTYLKLMNDLTVEKL